MGAGKKKKPSAGARLRLGDVARAATVITSLVKQRLGQDLKRLPPPSLRQTFTTYLQMCKRWQRRATLFDLHSLETTFVREATRQKFEKLFQSACITQGSVTAHLQQSVGALVCSLYVQSHAACALTDTALPAHSFSQFAVGIVYSMSRGVVLNGRQLVPVCPMLVDALPHARLYNASRSRSVSSVSRLSAHKGALVLQTALRSTARAMPTIEDQDTHWRPCVDLTANVARAYHGLNHQFTHLPR